jgi:hypothetical protein
MYFHIQGIHKRMVRYQLLFTFETAPFFCVCPVYSQRHLTIYVKISAYVGFFNPVICYHNAQKIC